MEEDGKDGESGKKDFDWKDDAHSLKVEGHCTELADISEYYLPKCVPENLIVSPSIFFILKSKKTFS